MGIVDFINQIILIMHHTDHMSAEDSSLKQKVVEIKDKVQETVSNVPSGTFLALAGGVLLASILLKKKGAKMGFIGRWLTPIVLTGIYSKISSSFSNDKHHTAAASLPGYKAF
jgi:hypothetical protein